VKWISHRKWSAPTWRFQRSWHQIMQISFKIHEETSDVDYYSLLETPINSKVNHARYLAAIGKLHLYHVVLPPSLHSAGPSSKQTSNPFDVIVIYSQSYIYWWDSIVVPPRQCSVSRSKQSFFQKRKDVKNWPRNESLFQWVNHVRMFLSNFKRSWYVGGESGQTFVSKKCNEKISD